MGISYFSTKELADAVPGGEVSWCLGDDGHSADKPWRVLTGNDRISTKKDSITIQEFRDRLTQAETDAILTAARTDVNIDRAIWLLSSQVDGLLHFEDPRVGQMLSYLMSRGILAPERPAPLIA